MNQFSLGKSVASELSSMKGVYVTTLVVHADSRGHFIETWRKEWVPGAKEMVQMNQAQRKAGSLVGFHYHLHHTDYWYVTEGTMLVALHDLRRSASTHGATATIELSAKTPRALYIPPGIAHAYYASSDISMTYLVDEYYDPEDELGVAWNDKTIGVNWPEIPAWISERDRSHPSVGNIPPDKQPG